MIEVGRDVVVPPGKVFSVLADGWSFASWVVGASHIRTVDDGWPRVGSRIHHSVGPWPLAIQDVTTVTAVEPDALLELDARLWPIGAAQIRLSLTPTAEGTRIVMAEELTQGLGRATPETLQGLLLRPRNEESLRRLEDIAVGREQQPGAARPSS